MNEPTLTTDAAQRVAQHSLARLGWEIRVADVNLTTETVRLTLASTCGRLITLDARGGKASVTRADRLAKSREHDATALKLHMDGRIQRCLDNHGAADLAWQMRDMFRRASLEALADAEVTP